MSGAAAGGYLLLSFLYFGLRVVRNPEHAHIGGLFTDPQIFIWSFAWWPHALVHGLSPVHSHVIWAPDGFNLAWVTSVPGLALVFSPVTWAFGPIASYNLACVLMPALDAWTAFLLCRYVTRRAWPSLVGGYLFGFSSYVLGGELSHLNTVSVFLVPLVALVVLRFVRGELGRRALCWRLGVLLGAQLYISTEVLFTLGVALVVGLAVAFAVAPELRGSLRQAVGPLVGAGLLAALLGSPLLYYALTEPISNITPGAGNYVADALNFVVPTRASLGGWWSASLARNFPGNAIEQGSYLGVPTLLIVGSMVGRGWRSPAVRFLGGSFALASLASLGAWLTVNGTRVSGLPWRWLWQLPLFDNVFSSRFSLYCALAAAVTVALWAASAAVPVGLRVAGSALAVLFVLPNVGWSAWAQTPDVPRLFTSGLVKRCLAQNENVIAVPVGPRAESLTWQAESHFWFRLAGGYVGQRVPDSFLTPPAITHLTTADNPSEVTTGAVLELARLKSIGAVVVANDSAAQWKPILAPIAKPVAAGGTLIYRLPGGPKISSACTDAGA